MKASGRRARAARGIAAVCAALLAGSATAPAFAATAPAPGQADEVLCNLVPSLMEPEPVEVCPLPPLPASLMDKLPTQFGPRLASAAPWWSPRPVPRPGTAMVQTATFTTATAFPRPGIVRSGGGVGGFGFGFGGGGGGGGGGSPGDADHSGTPPVGVMDISSSLFELPDPILLGPGTQEAPNPGPTPAAVPLPASALLLIGALAGLGGLRRRG